MSVELLLNVAIICLLVPTIIFAIILNKRLEVLRSSRNDLGRLIEAFNEATTRAEAGIPRLKQAADSTGAILKDQIQKAQTLRDDLAFMIERADAVVGKLEVSMRSKGTEMFDADKEPDFSFTKPELRSKKRSFSEDPDDVLSSAVSLAEGILRENPVKSKPFKRSNTLSSFNEVSSNKNAEDDRSEAERELLKALQSMR